MAARHTLVLAVLAPAALAALPASAQDMVASRSLDVTGSAPQICTMQTGAVRTGRLLNFSGTTGNVLRVQDFVDRTTLAVKAARAELQFAAVCNFPHRVRIESQHNGLWPTDGRNAQLAPGFTYAVPYEARVDWADVSGGLSADAKVNHLVDKGIAVDAAFAGDLTLSIVIAEGASNVEVNAPVEAGDFADTLRIYLEPR